jgi:hypothetical protein
MARAAAKATTTRPRKATTTRPRKAAPANRGHGEKGVAKYDPEKHPRGPDGRFLSKGGAAKAPKTPRTARATRPPAKPKLPKKVGTAKQRKGLADQIRAARKGAKTREARKALLHQVRDLRRKRSEWQRGQGKTQVEKLPRPPKEKKPAATKPATKPKAEKPAKPPKEPKKPPAHAPTAHPHDLRAAYEKVKHLPEAERHAAIMAHVEKHQTPAVAVKAHGMAEAEQMHSIPFDGYNLHYPKGDTGSVVRVLRGSELYAPAPHELGRHTKDVYMVAQANSQDGHWAKQYGKPGFESIATGGDGKVVFYGGRGINSKTLAHEMGHNLAAARYGMVEPSYRSAFSKAADAEAPPTPYARVSPAEDFAESVMMFAVNNAGLKKIAPKRHKVIARMLKDPNYAG